MSDEQMRSIAGRHLCVVDDHLVLSSPEIEPISHDQRVAAKTAAVRASLHARICWESLVEEIEAGGSGVRLRSDLVAAVASQSYAWAVCHSVDASHVDEGGFDQ